MFFRFTILISILLHLPMQAQQGIVWVDGDKISGVTLEISSPKVQVKTDREGHFDKLFPGSGIFKLIISMEGNILLDTQVQYLQGQLLSLHLVSIERELGQVVYSGNRMMKSKRASPVAIDVITKQRFLKTSSMNLSEVLGFQSGLRLETDCQTCNYTQIRMNGLPGSYNQILINSQPLFTSLLGLYGLEQIPESMIEKIEIMKGGGSVLYGSNAIAGTINLLLHEPSAPEMEWSTRAMALPKGGFESQTQGALSAQSKSKKAGVSLMGSYRTRNAVDLSGDGFSELPSLNGISLGSTWHWSPLPRHKAEIYMFYLQEKRRGGSDFTLSPEQSRQAEYRFQKAGAVGFQYRYEGAHIQILTMGSHFEMGRDHYTGVFQSPGWGDTRQAATFLGQQFTHVYSRRKSRPHILQFGYDMQREKIKDQVPGYQYLLDQKIVQGGWYIQDEWTLNTSWRILGGWRQAFHSRMSKPVWVPRLNIICQANSVWQFRAQYAAGFRAPQAFDTDMHMAFANGGVSRIFINPNLQSEKSQSFSGIADFLKAYSKLRISGNIRFFYTGLRESFILEEKGTDSSGNQILWRTNGSGAKVFGISTDFLLYYTKRWEVESGYTLQRSLYDQPVAWSLDVPPVRNILRTPQMYGFASMSYALKRIRMGIQISHTGPMLIPHFGGAPENTHDQLILSKNYWEVNVNSSYKWTIRKQIITITASVKNIFNQFQNDFDSGPNRDSNYIYGPSRPIHYMLEFRWKILSSGSFISK